MSEHKYSAKANLGHIHMTPRGRLHGFFMLFELLLFTVEQVRELVFCPTFWLQPDWYLCRLLMRNFYCDFTVPHS